MQLKVKQEFLGRKITYLLSNPSKWVCLDEEFVAKSTPPRLPLIIPKASYEELRQIHINNKGYYTEYVPTSTEVIEAPKEVAETIVPNTKKLKKQLKK